MDLLGQEMQSNKGGKAKKTVLTLLIISIIVLVVLILLASVIKEEKIPELSLKINGNLVEIQENMIIEENSKPYISIEKIANVLKYNYYGGGYSNEEKDDKNKGYIKNSNNAVIEYSTDSNKIIKIDSKYDYGVEEYKLVNNIIERNETKYIALEDLNVGCNVVYGYNEKENQISIDNTDVLVERYNREDEIFSKENYKIQDSANNQKAMLYNLLVVSKNGKVGVIDTQYKTVIDIQYKNMEYNEYLNLFIVQDTENNYGIVKAEKGKLTEIVVPQYDNIEIISYSPLLYKVESDSDYGILNKDGNIIGSIEYSEIGYNEDTNKIGPVCIIENVKDDDTGIVVCKEDKYGIINVKTGGKIVDFVLDKIYIRKDKKDGKYYVEYTNAEGQKLKEELSEYIKKSDILQVVE